MKKFIISLTSILLILVVALVLYNEGIPFRSSFYSLNALQTAEQGTLDSITATRKPSRRDFLLLSYQGYELPVFNQSSDTFLFCKQLIDNISIEQNIGCKVVKTTDGNSMTIAAYDKTTYRLYQIELTTLPVISITTLGGTKTESVSDDYCYGVFTVFDSGTGEALQYDIGVKTRGGTSKLFYPKKSYTVKFIDAISGKDESHSVLEMTENSRFALNSLYEDESKIRDIATLQLWEKMENTQGMSRDYSIDMIPSEVVFNGEYWGLYGFQEIVNVDSMLGGSQEEAATFKILYYHIPVLEALDPASEEWQSIELTSCSMDNPWECMRGFIEDAYYTSDDEFRSQVGTRLDMQNCKDFYLYLSFIYATDNIWKNCVFVQSADEAGEMKLRLVPWDTDQSLGIFWSTYTDLKVELDITRAERDFAVEGPYLLGKLWELDAGGFRCLTANRWFELRKGALSEESLYALIDSTFEEITLSGARARDAARWPNSAICADNSFIDEYISRRLTYLDDYYAGILAGNG